MSKEESRDQFVVRQKYPIAGLVVWALILVLGLGILIAGPLVLAAASLDGGFSTMQLGAGLFGLLIILFSLPAFVKGVRSVAGGGIAIGMRGSYLRIPQEDPNDGDRYTATQLLVDIGETQITRESHDDLEILRFSDSQGRPTFVRSDAEFIVGSYSELRHVLEQVGSFVESVWSSDKGGSDDSTVTEET